VASDAPGFFFKNIWDDLFHLVIFAVTGSFAVDFITAADVKKFT